MDDLPRMENMISALLVKEDFVLMTASNNTPLARLSIVRAVGRPQA
jgi:hypothetical protein